MDDDESILEDDEGEADAEGDTSIISTTSTADYTTAARRSTFNKRTSDASAIPTPTNPKRSSIGPGSRIPAPGLGRRQSQQGLATTTDSAVPSLARRQSQSSFANDGSMRPPSRSFTAKMRESGVGVARPGSSSGVRPGSRGNMAAPAQPVDINETF
jgi:hypothetical protein